MGVIIKRQGWWEHEVDSKWDNYELIFLFYFTEERIKAYLLPHHVRLVYVVLDDESSPPPSSLCCGRGALLHSCRSSWCLGGWWIVCSAVAEPTVLNDSELIEDDLTDNDSWLVHFSALSLFPLFLSALPRSSPVFLFYQDHKYSQYTLSWLPSSLLLSVITQA